jgi:hypothetical protein
MTIVQPMHELQHTATPAELPLGEWLSTTVSQRSAW